MSLLKNIKLAIANRALKLELQDTVREKIPNKFNFDKVKTVGILFDATNSDDLEIVKRYVVYMREHRKKVKAIGFFNTKNVILCRLLSLRRCNFWLPYF